MADETPSNDTSATDSGPSSAADTKNSSPPAPVAPLKKNIQQKSLSKEEQEEIKKDPSGLKKLLGRTDAEKQKEKDDPYEQLFAELMDLVIDKFENENKKNVKEVVDKFKEAMDKVTKEMQDKNEVKVDNLKDEKVDPRLGQKGELGGAEKAALDKKQLTEDEDIKNDMPITPEMDEEIIEDEDISEDEEITPEMDEDISEDEKITPEMDEEVIENDSDLNDTSQLGDEEKSSATEGLDQDETVDMGESPVPLSTNPDPQSNELAADMENEEGLDAAENESETPDNDVEEANVEELGGSPEGP